MPVNIGWYGNSQRIIQARFVGYWDVADFITTFENAAALMSQVSHPVHVIYDFEESTSTPRDFLAGLHFANRILPTNQGVVVYVRANAVIKAFVLMAKRTGLPAAQHIYNADTREQAYQIMIEHEHLIHTV